MCECVCECVCVCGCMRASFRTTHLRGRSTNWRFLSSTRFLQQIRGFIMSAIVFDCLHHCVRTKANGQQNSVDKG